MGSPEHRSQESPEPESPEHRLGINEHHLPEHLRLGYSETPRFRSPDNLGSLGHHCPGLTDRHPLLHQASRQLLLGLRLTRASTRVKPDTEIECQLEGDPAPTIGEGQPRASPAAGPDYPTKTHDDRESVATTALFVYTRMSTSSFLFFLNGGPVSIGARTHTLTA